ncbi:type IV secretory system conjugative DNA transfer family protein [Glutamicibacter sp. AOP38-B1-38]|uniref:type IV secretory system conjugative DNA transfer family protein n=1 Tax=Glutamicibacter sp. AOP38-B1-38 TaxID=3457680 RepID=UPI0040332035
MSFQIFRMSRQAGESSDPALFNQRASSFATKATSGSDGGVLIVVKTDSGVETYAGFNDAGVNSGAHMSLAQAVGARAESDVLPGVVFDAPSIAFAQYSASGFRRETQAGLDPFEVARVIANSLPVGAWVGVAFRSASKAENRRYVPWLSHRLNASAPQHHSVTSGAIVASFWAGGEDFATASSLLKQLTAELPGFDLDVKPVRFSGRKKALYNLALGLALVGGWFVLPDSLDVEIVSWLDLSSALLVLGCLFLVYGASQLANWFPNVRKSFDKNLAKGALPAPPRRSSKPRKPVKEHYENKTVKDSEGKSHNKQKLVKEFAGDYPLAGNAFMVGGNVIAGLASPHTDSQSGNVVSRERSTPVALTGKTIGPYIGDSESDKIRLSAPDMRYGVAVFGRPNGGKSVLIRSLWAWHLHERLNPCGKKNFPGKNNTMIAFESKGEGAQKYLDWAQTMGDRADLIDVMNPYTLGIDLFDVPGTIADRAKFFVDAMKYAFGEGPIGPESSKTLRLVFTASLAITPEIIDIALEDKDVSRRAIVHGGSPIHYAYILTGGASDRESVALWKALETVSIRLRERQTPDPTIDLAVDSIAPLFKGRTEAYRAKVFNAPMNKLESLSTLGYWWSVRRQKTSWSEIILSHRAIVINTGSTTFYNKSQQKNVNIVLTDEETKIVSSLLFFGMNNAIKRHCSGWYEQDKNITFFTDELALIAGENPEILMWFRDQGRAYGVRPILASQRPDQITENLRNNIMTYPTKMSFAQVDKKTAKYFAENITNDSSSNANDRWTDQDLMNLLPYHVVLVTHVDERLQSPVVVKLPNFEENMAGYSAIQESI